MDIQKYRKYFYLTLHIVFLTGLLYAIGHFLKTPRTNMETRRMWAYESWIIISFYSLLLYLTFIENGVVKDQMKLYLEKFKRITIVFVILLIFPWGLFLLFAPQDLMDRLALNSVYWRILGLASLFGALIYYFPYRFLEKKLSYYIIIFGIIDNLLAGLIITILFFTDKIPYFTWSITPLLFYLSYFFLEYAKKYKQLQIQALKEKR